MATADKSEAVRFYVAAGVGYPTADGRHLRVTADGPVRGRLALRNVTGLGRRLDEETIDLPGTDVLAAALRVADAGGRVWEATSHFGAGLLVARMTDPTNIYSPAPTLEPRGRRPADPPAGPVRPVLRRVVFSDDDRFVRPVTYRAPGPDGPATRTHEVQFKYTVLLLDVGFGRPHGDDAELSDLFLQVRVRLHRDGLWDYDAVESIGPLVWGFDWRELFRHNQFVRGPDGELVHGDFPVPLTFRPVRGAGEPQPHVAVG